MKSTKMSLGNGRRRSAGGNNPRLAIAHPPTFDPAIRLQKKFRYISTTTPSVNVAIAVSNLTQAIVMATAANSSQLLIDSIRLLKVEIWHAAAQGAATTVCEVAGSQSTPGPENRKSDICVGVQPAHVQWRPAPLSNASFWQDNQSSLELFRITCPATAIVDVTVELIFLFNVGDAVLGPTPAGATTGVIYGTTLDGNGLTGNLKPAEWTLLP